MIFKVEMLKLLTSIVTFLCLSDQISTVADIEDLTESVDAGQSEDSA